MLKVHTSAKRTTLGEAVEQVVESPSGGLRRQFISSPFLLKIIIFLGPPHKMNNLKTIDVKSSRKGSGHSGEGNDDFQALGKRLYRNTLRRDV